MARADGSSPHGIGGADSGSPSFSPDGRRIAYRVDHGPTSAVEIAGVDGGGAKTVVSGRQGRPLPVFSPDGTKLVVQESILGVVLKRYLWIVSADGGPLRQLIGPDGAAGPDEPDWQPLAVPASAATRTVTAFAPAVTSRLNRLTATRLVRRGGFSVRFSGRAPGRAGVSLRARASARAAAASRSSGVLARATRAVSRGKASVSVKLTRAGRRVFGGARRRHRSVRATVTATFKPPRGHARSRRASVRISP